MNKVLRYGFFVWLALLSFSGGAQNETKQWYFGQYSGLDFLFNPPAILTNTNIFSTASACMSGTAGNLLFYTDGSTVYNATQGVMANGTGLFGFGSSALSSQGVIIVKQPGNSNLYYVFTLPGNAPPTYGAAIYYSIVDMSLAAGLGSVTVKNSALFNLSCSKIAAARHCNGSDVWIVTHDNFSNNFRNYLLTSAGLSTLVVNSGVGTPVTLQNHTRGQIKISPNGRKLVLTTGGHLPWPLVELFDFDSNTGIVSNSLTLLLNPFPLGTWAGGSEFSPDGSKLYVTLNNGNTPLYQWDMCAGTNSAIAASVYTISMPTGFNNGNLQLAANGKIYSARVAYGPPYNIQTLGVINNPNVTGAGCNYVHAGQSIAPKSSEYQLPNFMSSYFNQRAAPPPFTFTVNSTTSCRTASFTMSATTPSTYGCAASGYTFTNAEWNFGDPTTGAANTSTLQSPTHLYSAYGTFTSMLVIHYTCGGGTDTLRQVVNVFGPGVSVNVSPSATLCSGSSVTIAGMGAITYTWFPGSIVANSIVLSPTVSASYSVIGSVLTCTNSSFISLQVKPTPTLSFVTASITCASLGSATVNAAGGTGPFSYTWTPTAQTGSIAAGLNPGNYTLTVMDQGQGCIYTSTTNFASLVPLTGTVSATGTISCFASSTGTAAIALGGGSGNQTYTWTNSPGAQTTAIANGLTAGVHTITVIDAITFCAVTQTFFVSQPPAITLNISPGTPTACGGDDLVLTVNGAGGTPAFSYSWTGGAVSASNVVNEPPGSKIFSVTSLDANGCPASATVLVTFIPVPLLTFNNPTVCSGNPVQLVASASTGSPTTYNWFPAGSANATLQISPKSTSVYSVNANYKGCNSQGIGTVVVTPLNEAITGFSYKNNYCSSDPEPLPALEKDFTTGGVYSTDGNLDINSGTGLVHLASGAPGPHVITYSVAQYSCTAAGSGTALVYVKITPVLNLRSQMIVPPGGSSVITVGGSSNYTWSPSSGLSCTNCADPVATPAEDIQYCVMASNNDCIGKACINVRVACDNDHNFSIPNAFSPNGDNNNEAFCLQGWDVCVSDFSVIIFDRWGEKVFESGDADFCWDGSYKGQLLASDVYIYVIKASYSNNTRVNKKGNITLVR